MNSDLRFKQLLKEYIEKTITREELIEFLNSIEDEKNLNEFKIQLETIWNNEFQEGEDEYEVDWDQLLINVKNSDLLKESTISIFKRRKWYVAAMIIGLSFLGYWWYNQKNDLLPNDLLSKVEDIDSTKHNPKKQVIHLSDGSTVILNSNSTLSYPKEFTDAERVVILNGEAFFDIKKNAGKPFKVITGDVVTTVLGTSFNIKAYSNDHMIAVSVLTGKVAVSNKEKILATLEPNDQLIFDKEEQSAQQQIVDINKTISWKPVNIKLENASLIQVMESLSKTYDMEYEFMNPHTQDCPITFTYSNEDSIEEVMTVIGKVLKLKYSISNKKIMIEGSNCSS